MIVLMIVLMKIIFSLWFIPKDGEMDEHLRQPYEGQLIKFTNVVKGWQGRWFILNPEIGTLEYYLVRR